MNTPLSLPLYKGSIMSSKAWRVVVSYGVSGWQVARYLVSDVSRVSRSEMEHGPRISSSYGQHEETSTHVRSTARSMQASGVCLSSSNRIERSWYDHT